MILYLKNNLKKNKLFFLDFVIIELRSKLGDRYITIEEGPDSEGRVTVNDRTQ